LNNYLSLTPYNHRQDGKHFFVTAANNDIELEVRSTNVLENAISLSINETTFSIGDISTQNSVAAPVYEEVEERVVYASMAELDQEGYLRPNPNPATHSGANPPPLPLRFLATGGLNVSAIRNHEDNIITPSSSFSSIRTCLYGLNK
jgi:hypothetical protein